MFRSFSDIALYFIIYSVLGWVCETIFCSLRERRYVNRGFLRGPYCPIYGFGAVAILLVSLPIRRWPLLVFPVAMAAATALEYFASWLLEALFQIRWWDYSENRFNLRGRVCLSFSLTFGLMGWGMTYLVHPVVQGLTARIPDGYILPLTNLLVSLFFLDLLGTLNHLLGFTRRLKSLQAQLAELREYGGQEEWFNAHDIAGSLERLRGICERDPGNPLSEKLAGLLGALERAHRPGSRLMKAFPHMRTRQYGEAVDSLRENLHRRSEAAKGRLWAWAKRLGHRTGAAGKSAAKSIVRRLDAYTLFWVFVIAGLLGYLVETAFCLVTTGTVESRQGMLYGPFNQVYGLGAVLMVVVLTPLQCKNDRWLFAASALLGGGFEALCSLVQERLLGSVSWRYDGQVFALFGGRTSLTFMLFWGILGVIFIKGVLPRLQRLIGRIPKRQGRTLTAVLAVFLCVNAVLSATAVHRWSQRDRGVPAESAYERFLDREFPDSFLREVYPNLQMVGQPEEQ